MESKFKIGDKIICRSADVITLIHNLYWPKDRHGLDYIHEVSKVVNQVVTVKNIYRRQTESISETWCIEIEEKIASINDWVLPEDIFELYYEPFENDDIPSIFG